MNGLTSAPKPAEEGKAPATKTGLPLPAISLPKGGGAIRGMGEKFAANPVTGTGSMTVPIATSPGRSGFGPQLALSYDSGAGNGPYGFGWSFSLPAITRKTDKGLPKYEDADESDVLILSGAEDLVPIFKTDPATGEFVKDANGNFVYDEFPRDGYLVRRYRPRIEGLFARIEHWTRQSDGDVHWRSISRDNITTFYGKTEESRIANPGDPSRIFSWLICQSYDDRGNAIVYEYQPEDSHRILEDHGGQIVALAHERNRNDATRSANRYLKRIKYGNRTPNRNLDSWQATDPTQLPEDTWMFEVVFDYGEGHYIEDAQDAEGRIFTQARIDPPAGSHWPARRDPFSSYRASFEVRTYRLCRRVLMFHHFPDELGTPDYLVRSTEFTYNESPIAAFIAEVTQSGYVRQADGSYLKKSLPPLRFEYTKAEISDEIETVEAESLKNLPVGANGLQYQWLDLDGEGLQCVLAEQEGGWYYKRNRSPISTVKENGREKVVARFEPLTEVATQPAIAEGAGARHQFLDLAGDGNLDLVQFEKPVCGFFERTEAERWESFIPFESAPNVRWNDPNLRFVDLTGDGHADILITENEALTWYPSLAEEGFGTAIRIPTPREEEEGPAVVFADAAQAIFVADLSGDGLTDIVRIRNGEVCYWPNLGYGRFGAKVTMDNAPWFDALDQFDPKRVRLADIDGSGTTDIIYLERNRVAIYRNECGNRWSPLEHLASFPAVDDVSAVSAVDLLGNGTACLVWSSPLPGHGQRQMRYIALMQEKPHLLVWVKNNLGAETVIHYAPSTKFYLDDRQNGKSWITRLPFPVHVVERVETHDLISCDRFVTRYAYHHGYFDGEEREFRGFGMVEQWDTEELGALKAGGTLPDASNIDESSYVPPAYTKTWFHTGAYIEGERISRHFEDEYYHEGDESEGVLGLTDEQLEAMLLPDTQRPTTLKRQDGSSIPWELTADEMREACRALKGAVLRREIYACDETDDEDRPYSATEQNYTVELLQPQGEDRYAVFFTHPRESIDFHYERKLVEVSGKKIADPRVTHAMSLEVDGYGNVLKSVAIGYGRRLGLSPLQVDDKNKQEQIHVTYTENEVTNAADEGYDYRTPLPYETRTYELLKTAPDRNLPDIANLFGFDEMVAKTGQASDGNHDLPYEDVNGTGATANHPYRRVVEHVRIRHRKNDLSGLLSNRELQSLGLPGESYKLAFTPGLLGDVFQRNGQELLPNPADVLGGQGADRGGYVDLDGDGRWWIPSGRVFYSPISNDLPVAELAFARAHFFLPHRYRDPFANEVITTYDSNEATPSKNHNLLLVETQDPLGNVVTVKTEDDDHNVAIRNDYRVLQPYWVTDPNRNRTRVEFDALGMVVATAVMGKAGEGLGDNLTNFKADLTQTDVDKFHNAPDPHGLAESHLKDATTRVVYDLHRFHFSQQAHPTDSTLWEAPYAATLAREMHTSDPLPPQGLRIQISFSYSDGFGREIQKKIQAEPGPAPRRDANGNIIVGADGQPVMTASYVSPRWVGSGWTVFNNKGKPVRQYEPFFTDTHRFEFEVEIGVSPVLFYDPVERVIATLHPNHTYQKTVFDPWQQTTSDVNDTVLVADPKSDPDVGQFFGRLPDDECLPTWHALRTDPTNAGTFSARYPDPVTRASETQAAQKTEVHARTPSIAHADSLGRTFLTIVHNRFKQNNTIVEEKYPTRAELDIEGNERAVRDAVVQNGDVLGRVVMRYDYDMLGNRIHQASMEAGERWMLNDVMGNPIRAWDSRGHQFKTEYDQLRRPLQQFVRGTGNTESDPRTLNSEVLFAKIEYGEGQTNDTALNLRTRVFRSYDGAGVVANHEYDFKGNLRRSSRTLADNYQKLYDWNNDFVQPSWETFTSSTTYDALNRPLTVTTPDGSIYRPTFNEANLLNEVDVNVRGETTPTRFVTNIDYNAKGQRELIEYGNNVKTEYSYDPLTVRLRNLKTTRGADHAPMQDLSYTYDPAGNITKITDAAQQTIYFNNQVVTPDADYIYDSIYRLIQAEGREHIGQVPQPETTWNDEFRVNLQHPQDGQAMRGYTERYEYDPVGNFERVRHIAANGQWTRSYTYDEPSLLEPPKKNNRLSSTIVGWTTGTLTPEFYPYDAHGNMTRMPHLLTMDWDFRDQLQHVDLGGGGNAYYV
jgi:YD repeat-containing protein